MKRSETLGTTVDLKLHGKGRFRRDRHSHREIAEARNEIWRFEDRA